MRVNHKLQGLYDECMQAGVDVELNCSLEEVKSG